MKTKNKSTSLADVAKLAGVSLTTASRVLSNANYPVKAQTREKVLFAAEKLNYVISVIGRALATQQTRTIAAIMSDFSEPFFSETMIGAERVCQKYGFIITLFNHERDLQRELQYFRFLRGFKPEGIIVGSCSSNRKHMQRLNSEFMHLSSIGIPIVSINRHLLPIHTVHIDNIEMAKTVTDHLLSLGHRDIAFITGTHEWLTNDDRLMGYQKALEYRGIQVDPKLITCGYWSTPETYYAVKRLIEKRIGFTALLASNDTMAVGAMKAIQEAGLKIPDDVSVAGMNNIPNTDFWHPALTTVAVPMRELGAEAVKLIIESRENDVESFDKLLPVELMIRQSTAIPNFSPKK